MRIYTGRRLVPEQKTVSEVEVLVLDKGRGWRKTLRHRVLHSPTGMNWGYGGSGPADLALSILCNFLGDSQKPTVRGGCWGECEHNYCLAVRHHQGFEREFVAGWGDSWEITEVEIGAWLVKQDAGKAVSQGA